MSIVNWGKVLTNLSAIIEADRNQYFDLLSFCNDRGLNYQELINFMNVGKLIISGELDISKDLRNELKVHQRIIKQLEISNLTP